MQAGAQTSSPPMTLVEALATALKYHPQIGAAQATQMAAQARVGQARAALLPQLSSTTQIRGEASYQTGTRDGRDTLQSFRYSSQIGAAQLLYDFGRTGGRIAGAQAGVRAAAGDCDGIRAQVVLGASTAYFGVLQAEALYQVAVQNLKQQEQRRAQAESFFATGTRPKIDVLNARTACAQAQLLLVHAGNAIELARAQLLLALGVTDPSWRTRKLSSDLPGPLSAETQSVEALLPQALTRRPEYAALHARVTQAEAQVRVLRGDYYPQLSLSGTLAMGGSVGGPAVGGTGGITRTDVPTDGQPGFSASSSLTLSWPLFSGFQTRYAVREAEALRQVAQANLEALRQQVRSGLEQALLQVAEARQSRQAAELLLLQAEEQLAMAAGRYQAGAGNIIELSDAQFSAISARVQRVEAEYTLAATRAGLMLQLGTLLDLAGAKERR